MCLLPSMEHFEVQHWENEDPGPLLSIPNLQSVCPNVIRRIGVEIGDY